ncbi:hypothetical protein SAMN06297229_1880 [Pseudidiomarina planktonica]|uniref:DUF4935 domain-containing protein n=1 Tax=Pseudidiomarina planktonica TaxID=1323738 RepID=A0A1Y6FW03_9GAMM|nr:PIN domain-containing protein [Pseudidiomarina planktonica]RUO63954.1 hypothetical protein CWI77_09555 [Pseudidiomarina planktonica]SMQ79960.1 hypothetical protein SAMN06297229_1880 [Pseudidiomarina planktonica]
MTNNNQYKNSDPLKIIFDTNILREDPSRTQPALKAVERLVRSTGATLFLPYVVVQEFLTHQKLQLDDAAETLNGSLISFMRKSTAYEPAQTSSNKLLSEIESLREAAFTAIEKNFYDWCEEYNVQVVEVTEKQAKDVLEAYFTGSNPFTKIKERKDFPDAYIYQQVKGLADKFNQVNFISKDKKLTACLREISGVRILDSIEMLTETKEFKSSLLDSEVSRNLMFIMSNLRVHDDIFFERLNTKVLFELTHPQIGRPGDVYIFEHSIIENVYCDAPETFQILKLFYYGNGEFGVQFSIEVIFEINSPHYPGEVHSYNEYRSSIDDLFDSEDALINFESDNKLSYEAHGLASLFILPNDLEQFIDGKDLTTILRLSELSLNKILRVNKVYS